jgi:hypothetical protein
VLSVLSQVRKSEDVLKDGLPSFPLGLGRQVVMYLDFAERRAVVLSQKGHNQ